MIGDRLGPYRITAKLGEGGMGEVYRATDTNLKRDVALKVLPAAFTEDRERLARFEREAQLLAQLHHPNIASIFGLEEANGVRALVMELVEGPTLAERIQSGPLSLEESLSIAAQIALALEEAHEKGIVHRDLKPQNIKASTEGKVKVLDFGLAKAMDPTGAPSSPNAGSASQLAQSPTLTLGATQMGMILGTAGYMAPEQARGSAVDKRADIWAFGVVLWEMLTGGRLFEGESVLDTLSAVMRQEIDLRRLPAGTPQEIRRLLRRCLERNPKNRLHDIADARIAIAEVQTGAHEAPGAAGALPTAGPRRGPILAVVATVAALALAVGTGTGWLLRRPAPMDPGSGARWALAIPDGLALSTADFPQLALSEDGRLHVAVVVDSTSTARLLLRSSDEIEPRLLPETERAGAPFFAPDGKWIGFFRDQSLFRIPVGGGPPVELATINSSTTTRGATWSRDGFIYFAPNTGVGLSRVSENGGPVTKVTELDPQRDERTHRWPQALPDGSAVLFTCDTLTSTEYYDDARIEAVRVATGERRVLVEGASQARYATGGRLVFARGGSLFSIAFDPRSLAVQGSPELIVEGVATDVGSGAVQFALSASGAALWAPGGRAVQYQLFWVDRTGAETPVAIPPAPYSEAALSPDGKRVALVGGAGRGADLWVSDLERGTLSRSTAGESVANPVWTPDSTRIAYAIQARGGADRRWRIDWRLADGSRDAEVLLDDDRPVAPSGFTPDGRELLYSRYAPDISGSEIYLLSVAGAHTPQLVLGGPAVKRSAVLSPDGRWLAHTSNEGGLQNVFVRPFPAAEGRWQISAPIGYEPRWSRDQKEIFFRADTAIYRVEIDTRRGFSAGKPERLFDRVSASAIVHTYAPDPADQRFFTPRSPAGRGSLRTVYLDLGFARRLAGPSRTDAGRP